MNSSAVDKLMSAKAYRELHVLEEISATSQVTQRGLAKRRGVALGLTNLLLYRMAKKGYIKIVNLQRNRLPRGWPRRAG